MNDIKSRARIEEIDKVKILVKVAMWAGVKCPTNSSSTDVETKLPRVSSRGSNGGS